MKWFRKTEQLEEHELRLLHDLLSRWEFTAGVDGVVTVRPMSASVAYQDLDLMIRQLRNIVQELQLVVFDFGPVTRIEAPWTPVLALIIEFSRENAGSCRIDGLRGQPAGVAKVYQRSPELTALLEVTAKTLEDDSQAA